MLCHSDTSVFVVRGLIQTFYHVCKRSTRWQCENSSIGIMVRISSFSL
jgi:hypothetical protein